ncbi:MAG: class I SAM-dependent methyltransferase [Micrococcales bacterium]|nr:class I SAM-dependent methyltransferase [Micrococcales bacterium]
MAAMDTCAQFQAVSTDVAVRAARTWWDANAAAYQAEHAADLGTAKFLWCPEGLDEADAHLLGDVAGATVLEVGAGAAQCSRWLVGAGARVLATDVSAGMLAAAAGLNASSGVVVPLVQADARALPLPAQCMDVVFTAFGALPFVADAPRVHTEVARVLRPGGRWVFSVSHPVRWAFPDDPGLPGLTAFHSYFDRRPYTETDDSGAVVYTEHHRTVGDLVADVVGAGFVLDALVEPEWPDDLDRAWGGWGPVRGALLPGTLIVQAHLPG